MAVMGQRELKDRGYLCVMDPWVAKWQGKQDFYLPRYRRLWWGYNAVKCFTASSKELLKLGHYE